ncbi:unnamed protein product [marine sediment metagenome]|uniref:Uncharacterized protein n=1 Tax=marine sediment metagenome TaxID=412755 RepID=X1S8Y9_9ZZZZ
MVALDLAYTIMIIHICPECKEYLPPLDISKYKYCTHCGICLVGKELLEAEIPDNKKIGDK